MNCHITTRTIQSVEFCETSYHGLENSKGSSECWWGVEIELAKVLKVVGESNKPFYGFPDLLKLLCMMSWILSKIEVEVPLDLWEKFGAFVMCVHIHPLATYLG